MKVKKKMRIYFSGLFSPLPNNASLTSSTGLKAGDSLDTLVLDMGSAGLVDASTNIARRSRSSSTAYVFSTSGIRLSGGSWRNYSRKS